VLQSDCSDFALGGVLLQEFVGELHPIAFHSRKLNSAERNYSVHEREMLALVECVKTWSHYVGGTTTQVQTDHKSLEHFWHQPKLPGRQTRWMEALQHHNVDIVYIKGESNVVADALSRRPDHAAAESSSMHNVGVSTVISGLDTALVQALVKAAAADPTYTQLVQQVERVGLKNHKAVGGLVLHTDRHGRQRLMVPADDAVKQLVLAECHDGTSSGHLGYLKTFGKVSASFVWPRQKQDVIAYCKSCPVCMAPVLRSRRAC
jgi:hypothetical protein